MAEVLSRVNTASRLFGWLVLAGSAFVAADLAAAGLERSMQPPPRPFEQAAVAPAAAPREGQVADGLRVVLRQPAPVGMPATAAPGGPPGEEGPEGGPDGAAPPPQLSSLSLKGTLVAGGTRAAILEVAGKTRVVAVGEEISGFKLTRVESTWVGLRQGDQAVQLVLETVKEGPGSAPAAAPMADAALVPQPPAPLPAPAGDDPGAPLSMEDIRAQLDNASRMAQQVRVVPKSKDGQTYGVQLEFRQPDNLMARLGLQHGDVLLAVNGNPIRGAEDLYKAYMTMRNADALELQVERGGQTLPVQYQLAR